MRFFTRCLAVLAICAVSTTALAQQTRPAEMVDNPVYLSWARYKPGTSVTLKQTTEIALMQGMATESQVTQKLLEVKAESVTLEVTTRVTIMGQVDESTGRSTIPAKVEKGQEYVEQNIEGLKVQASDMKEGKEKMEVKGATVEAATREFTISIIPPATATATAPTTNPASVMMVGTKLKVKTWTSAEVPGGTIRAEQAGTMGVMGEMKTLTTLVDYTIVK